MQNKNANSWKEPDFMADSRGKVKLKFDVSTPDQQFFPIWYSITE